MISTYRIYFERAIFWYSILTIITDITFNYIKLDSLLRIQLFSCIHCFAEWGKHSFFDNICLCVSAKVFTYSYRKIVIGWPFKFMLPRPVPINSNKIFIQRNIMNPQYMYISYASFYIFIYTAPCILPVSLPKVK